MVNLITSLLLIFGVGFSSANMDHESNINDEPSKSIENINGQYIFDGKITIYDSKVDNFNKYYPYYQEYQYNRVPHSYTFSVQSDGYITADLSRIYNSSVISDPIDYTLTGTNQRMYQKLKFEVYFNPSEYIIISALQLDGETWDVLLNIDGNDYTDSVLGDSKYIYVSNCRLSNLDYADNISDDNKEWFSSFEGIETLNIFIDDNVVNDSSNPYFSSFLNAGGYYNFDVNFNPWTTIQSTNNSVFEFGTPNQALTYSNSKNYYQVFGSSYPSPSTQYFFNYTNTLGHLIKSVDIFEGYFRFGTNFYTNIRLYFDVWLTETGYAEPYNVRYSQSSFLYASFYNSQTLNEYVYLNAVRYQWRYAIGTTNEYHKNGLYNPSLSVEDNYDVNWSNYQGLVQFTDIEWKTIPSVQFIYSLNRPSNTQGLRSGTSFYDLLHFTPTFSPNEETNTYNNLLNVFGLIRLGWNGIFPILSMEVLPNLYLGTLIFIPFVFLVIFAVIRLFKR